MNDALGHDALQNLLESGNRIKELREDIAQFEQDARDEETEMWRALRKMNYWKDCKRTAEAELAEQLKKEQP